MSDYRDLLEQERRRHAMRDGSLEGLRRRRDRKRRNGQILAGVLALVIAAAGIGGSLFALRGSTGPQPADRTPTPTPTGVPAGEVQPSSVSGPIQFIDRSRGWMVNGAGEILATTDGGKTWKVQLSGPTSVTAIAILDEQLGWAVFDGGLLITTDGGAEWSTWSNQALSSLQFITPKLGWGVEAREGIGALLRSDDAGRTWTRVSLEVNSVCFVTERFGWAAGAHEAGAALFRTTDGGENWTEMPVPMPGGDYFGWRAAVRCAGEDAWVLVSGDIGAGHVAYAVFRTKGEGSALEPVLQDSFTHPIGQDLGVPESTNPWPGPLAVPDASSARFLTWCPPCGGDQPFVSVVRTQDGGATWEEATVVDANSPGDPVGISFVDPDTGWVLLGDLIGDERNKAMVVLRTSDGGQTWEQP